MCVAWDNIGRLDKTVSGEENSNRVNDIVVQLKLDHILQNVLPDIAKSNERRMSPSPFLLPAYDVGQRLGPTKIQNVEFDTSKEVQDARIKILVWIHIRMASQDAQTVNSWPGLDIQIRDGVNVNCQ